MCGSHTKSRRHSDSSVGELLDAHTHTRACRQAVLSGVLEIPCESRLQVPYCGTLPMPSRSPMGWALSEPVDPSSLEDLSTAGGEQLARLPRSHMMFAGASRGSAVNLPRRSEARRPLPSPLNQMPHRLRGPRRPAFFASSYSGPPVAPQGDGACTSDRSCSPASSSRLQDVEVEEERSGNDRSVAPSVPSRQSRSRPGPSTPQPLGDAHDRIYDRARSVPLHDRNQRVALVIYDQVSPPSTVPQAADMWTNEAPVTPRGHEVEGTEELERHVSHRSVSELSSPWQVAEELGQSGGMVPPRYLLVRLGECIPAETGAAPVHRSRLDCGPQWRDFLNFTEASNPDGVALEEVLTCPCCLSIFRQPIALPCGHNLCRGCYIQVFSQPASSRRCPLCRTDLPRFELRVNVALAAVSDSLRAFQTIRRPHPRPNAGDRGADEPEETSCVF
ncbi:TRIM31 [Symbiodinium natans]|uniref:TRIM31 protein n=1 Tax=Symbiodinium natans TaxID=878477 RepID=A0A812LYM9_9DINO|nr:TRIM31 [Symbiodinium natans]